MPSQQIQLQISDEEREFAEAMQELLDKGLIEKKTDEYGREVYVTTEAGKKAREEDLSEIS